MFLAEGEEILGSPTYRQYVAQYAERLKSVKASFVPAMAQSAEGTVSVGLGLKGMVVLELTASGEKWGRGPAHTVHSSTASLVSSPPFRLARALACLVDKNGEGCEVPELKKVWKRRKRLAAREKALLAEIAERSAGKDWRDVLPLGGVVLGELVGVDPVRRPRRMNDSPRYAAMEAFFDLDGPAGRVMMASTAHTTRTIDGSTSRYSAGE